MKKQQPKKQAKTKKSATGIKPPPKAPPQGWLCPKCLIVYSPDVDRCFCAQNKAREATQPKPPPLTDEMLKEFDEILRRQRERQPPPPPMTWPHYMPPVVIQPWHPDYPFKPMRHFETGDPSHIQYTTAPSTVC